MKQYREDNKHKLKEKITCQCGSVVTKHHKARHERNKKHINLMK
jgi:hypothetical protein